MKPRTIPLVISIALKIALIAGIAGVTGWKYYRKMTRPFGRDYYESKVSLFTSFQKKKADIVFVGDSHTDRCDRLAKGTSETTFSSSSAACRAASRDGSSSILGYVPSGAYSRPVCGSYPGSCKREPSWRNVGPITTPAQAAR